ncbi:MAG TPA: hypothetical protein VFT85_07385 [Acidimicrobiia bacterium]|nr:hypothetical protein [Acidimicrobiia bacterium]
MRGAHGTVGIMVILALMVTACAGGAGGQEVTSTTAPVSTTAQPATTSSAPAMDDSGDHGGYEADPAEIAKANLATAGFQDVVVAEAAGYGNTMDALGCFENPEAGGMGLHYLKEDLMDDVVDISQPEALVYELDADGEIVDLVAHEYIVPVEAWTSDEAPSLFGLDFHQHPVLPLWVLHAWIWKDNPAGMFEDWNPKVRMCPEGVPIFGVDLPAG